VSNLDPTDYPDPFFIFVNHASPTTLHNFNINGAFFSTPSTGSPDDFLPFIPNRKFPGELSPFLHGVTSAYRLEWNAEQARLTYAPEAPSRLGAVFAFGSYAECKKVVSKYPGGWDLGEVERFRPAPELPIVVRKVNMEIVSLLRTAYVRGSMDERSEDAIWAAYWGGEASASLDVQAPSLTSRERLTSGCIWEYLIDGRVERA
jgi:hypothetical protein